MCPVTNSTLHTNVIWLHIKYNVFFNNRVYILLSKCETLTKQDFIIASINK